MLNALETTDSKYEQTLHTALQSATTSTDLVDALINLDDSQQSDRLKWTLINYTKSHLSSVEEATMIQDAITALN